MMEDSNHPQVQMYRVCWVSLVGCAKGRGRPLPRDVAEFVARDESLGNPMRRFWVEECSRNRDALHSPKTKKN